MSEDFVVSARKYRPQTFATVVGQSLITSTLKSSITRQHLAHAYLFCGPRGVGKTTCARIFAKTINCLSLSSETEACDQCESCQSFNEQRSYNIHELDAASNNSVDDIRQLIEQVRVPPQVGKYSVYIIDEVHMLSAAAFNAFLKTLEEPPAYAIFILATTEKHKILPTILSRCQVYDFNRIRIEDTVEFLKYISSKEDVQSEERALHVIAQKADGAMRDALSIFDQVVSFCGTQLTYNKVIENLNVLDYEYYFKLTQAFLEHDYIAAMLIFNDISTRGFEIQHFILGLNSHFRDLLMCKDAQTAALLEAGEDIRKQYTEQAAKTPTDFLFEALNIVGKCAATYKQSSQPRLHAELCMLNIANIGNEPKRVATIAPAPNAVPVTPATAAPATPAAAPKPEAPAVISIKDELKKIEEKQQSAATPTDTEEQPSALGKTPFSEEMLKDAWRQFVEQLEDKNPRLKTALTQGAPELGENFEVCYLSPNTLFYEAMCEAKNALSLHLKTVLNNADLVLSILPPKEVEKATKPYYPENKFDYFAEKNKALLSLKEELGLDY